MKRGGRTCLALVLALAPDDRPLTRRKIIRGAAIRAMGRQLTSREQKILLRGLPAGQSWIIATSIALFGQLYWRPVATAAGSVAIVYFLSTGVIKAAGLFA